MLKRLPTTCRVFEAARLPGRTYSTTERSQLTVTEDSSRQAVLGNYLPWLHTEPPAALPGTHFTVHSAAKRACLDRASTASYLTRKEISDNLADLARLVPSFLYSQSMLSPALLVRLAEDVPDTLARVAHLREQFPKVDLARILGTRPELVVREVFIDIPVAFNTLARLFPGADITRVIERQPFLLVFNVEAVIDELMRDSLLPSSLRGPRIGWEVWAERILFNINTSAIVNTAAYQKQRQQLLRSQAQTPTAPKPS